TPSGNGRARQTLAEVFDIVDADWRGIGTIPASGYRLSAAYRHRDARALVSPSDTGRRRRGEMPPGCGCAKVVLGQIYPDQCPLYGNPCTPRRAIGPCMVSDEGACRIWWSQTPKQQAEPSPNPPTPDERARAAS
ncbi:MAG: hydrogenase formation protein HypD, partial [Pseudomonadota bacterium]|nr:hydrogenase formation protein HypD [Pseudomonadota bacterium]